MKRILVAYDGEEPARRALAQGAELAKAFDGELAVVTVTPRGMGFPDDPWNDRQAHERVLNDAASWLKLHGISARLYSPAGDPGRSVENLAESGGFDTIVVGSRHLGPVGRFMQGSVSEHVATNANATVVIAR